MEIPEQFSAEVDVNVQQAVREGWAPSCSTATTVAVTLGVLLTRMDTIADQALMQQVRRCVTAALALG